MVLNTIGIYKGKDITKIGKKITKYLYQLRADYLDANVIINQISVTSIGKKNQLVFAVIYEIAITKESVIEDTIKKVLKENPKTKIGFMKSLEKEGR